MSTNSHHMPSYETARHPTTLIFYFKRLEHFPKRTVFRLSFSVYPSLSSYKKASDESQTQKTHTHITSGPLTKNLVKVQNQ